MSGKFSNTSIVTSFDDNYFDYAAVMVKSFSNNYHENEVLKFTCLVPKESLHREEEFINLIKTKSLKIEFVNAESFNSFQSSGKAYESRYISNNMYHRLFIGSILKEFSKAIYIDPDALILRDVKPLLNYKTQLPLAAVVEYTDMAIKDLGTEDIPYFNNGVFIADLNFWRDKQIEKKLVEWLLINEKKDCPDQSAMNEIFKYLWTPLPINFNLLAFKLFEDKTLEKNFNNPLIVHFVGPFKPWDNNVEVPIWSNKWKVVYKSIFKN